MANDLKTPIFFLVVKILVIPLIILLIAEAFTRIFITSPANTKFDSELLWVYLPNTTLFRSHEGGARLKLNSFGMNDDELPSTKQRHRVLVLGDSFTLAAQVERSRNFVSLTNDQLKCVRLINGGRDALQPFQLPIIRNRLKEPLQIDSILLVLNKNDIFGIKSKLITARNNAGQLEWKNITYQKSTVRELLDPVMRHSALATVLTRRLNEVTMPEPRPKSAPRQIDAEQKELVAELLRTMSSADDVRILFLPFLSYEEDRRVVVVEETKMAWNVLSEVAGRFNIPVVSAEIYFKESYERTGQPAAGFPNQVLGALHLNESGHAAAAAALTTLYGDHCN